LFEENLRIRVASINTAPLIVTGRFCDVKPQRSIWNHWKTGSRRRPQNLFSNTLKNRDWRRRSDLRLKENH